MLDGLLRERGIEDYLAWSYSPLALPLLSGLCPRAVIYDLMDEPCAPGSASSSLMCEREAALLKMADLVLASGPSLYEARRDMHPNVQCLPNAVDASHFAPPAEAFADDQDACEARRLQGCIPEPRLGFFGVIDERIDLALVAALADADPSWQIVMAGPVLKVDPALLPRRANIHWLGMQPYSRLPRLVAGWDVCLMPFLLNDSTRYLSPAKTLEYMAAEKPVVSTALPDVISLYGDVVRVSPTRPGFVDHCREALGENAHRRAQRVMEMTQYVARFSWDASARAVHGLIEKQLLSRIEGPRRSEAMLPAVSRRSASSHLPGMPMGRGFTPAHPGTPTAH
jgi:glycosyltransferase involved in cell wall biosynthesis